MVARSQVFGCIRRSLCWQVGLGFHQGDFMIKFHYRFAASKLAAMGPLLATDLHQARRVRI